MGLGAERYRRIPRPITGGKPLVRAKSRTTRAMKARLLEEAVHCDELAAQAERAGGERKRP